MTKKVTITYTVEIPTAELLSKTNFDALRAALQGKADATLKEEGLPNTTSFEGIQVQKFSDDEK